MKNTVAVCLLWTMIVGFWGMTYPEFCFTKDSIQVINPQTGLIIREFDCEKDFDNLLNAKKDDIKVNFKILEWLNQSQKRE